MYVVFEIQIASPLQKHGHSDDSFNAQPLKFLYIEQIMCSLMNDENSLWLVKSRVFNVEKNF